MMARVVRTISKVVIALALALLAAIATVPWIIGAAGGPDAGMVAYGLFFFGAIYGAPAVVALLSVGGIGMLCTGGRK